MSLKAIPDNPGLLRDPVTGTVVELASTKLLDKTFLFTGRTTGSLRPLPLGIWILQDWSILVHPWPKVVHPSIIVYFTINGYVMVEVPLFDIVKPLSRSKYQNIVDRLVTLKNEKAIRMPPGYLDNMLINQTHDLRVEIQCPRDRFEVLRESLEVFELHLYGRRREAEWTLK